MREKLGIAVVIAAGWLLVGLPSPPAVADHGPGHAQQGPETCYLVADSNADAVDGEAEDLLTKVDRDDPDPATNETNIGTGTGTFNIEAIALQPGTGVLFAADAGTIGTLDTTTGRFTEIGLVGSGSGALGKKELKDIDGLSFDATTGFLYGTERRPSGAEDLLLQIDPATGVVVPGAIAGEDYAVVNAIAGLPDIDAIAVDPVDGTMFAVANDDGRKDHLVRIDKATGEATDIGVLGAEDVEGLGFASGQLIGTTGKIGGKEGIWDIDKVTGTAGNRRPLDNGRDYESFDCLNAPNPLPPPPVETPPVASAPSAPEPVRAPQAAVGPVVVTAPAPAPPAVAPAPAPPAVAAAPELPRTGGEGKRLLLASGLGLAAGGLAVVGGTRRPLRRKRRRA
jgi:LPXTG-motif cell wall-anchored protein